MAVPKVISFSSGKGGVGKSTLVTNLAHQLARQNYRVLMVDADWSLGKLGLMFGAKPKWTVESVIKGEVSIRESITPISEGLSLLASPSGVVGMEELSESARHQLIWEMESLASDFDFFLIDHSSGVHWGVLPFAAASHHHVVVTTPDPTSYMDAYAIMKILSKRFRIRSFSLLVTMSQPGVESDKIIEKFLDIAQSQLSIRVQLLEILGWEPRLGQALRKQKPFSDLFPQAPFSQAMERLARRVPHWESAKTGGLKFFMNEQFQNLES